MSAVAGERGPWRAVLTLVVLAPVVAELIGSTNTPTVIFLNPLVAGLLTLLYAPSALLLRELWVRRRVDWRGGLLLGAAFATLNEGVVAGVFFAPDALGFGGEHAGRLGGVNWTLVVDLVTFHTFVSLCVPIVLTQLSFPSRAGEPWLGQRGMRTCWTLAGLVGVLSVLPEDGEPKPQAGARLLAIGLAALMALLALRLAPRPLRPSGGSAFGLVASALAGILLAVAFGVAFFVVPALLPAAGVPAGLLLLGLVVLLLRRWSSSAEWTEQHSLLIVVGVLTPSMLSSLPRVAVLQPASTVLFAGFLVLLHRSVRARAQQPAETVRGTSKDLPAAGSGRPPDRRPGSLALDALTRPFPPEDDL